MEKIARESYPQVELLKQVKGVGTHDRLTFVLTLEDRIGSQEVARWVFLGLALAQDPERARRDAISKEGDLI